MFGKEQQGETLPKHGKDEEGDKSERANVVGVGDGGAAAADKKKKRKKKNSAAKASAETKAGKFKQTDPPTVPVADLVEAFTAGQRQDYTQDWNLKRATDGEKRVIERMHEDAYEDWRHGAEVHRQVRMWARTWIKPGITLMEIADRIEEAVKRLTPEGSLNGGMAFPCGLSVNHVAAHFAPNPGDKTVLGAQDVLKVDFGVHVNGRVIDSAFTMCWDHRYDNLLEAVREATNAGVRACGIDVRLCDVGEAVQEVMESYEVELNGRTYTVRPIRNLCGHDVGPYRVHAGKSVPIVRNGDCTRMEEGDTFAIETFGSTGRGFVQDVGECSHYMRNYASDNVSSRVSGARQLMAHITRNHGTLAWAKRWLDKGGLSRYQLALKGLVDCGAVEACPPLLDEKGCYIAQFEHTVCLKPTCKEVFTVGDDY